MWNRQNFHTLLWECKMIKNHFRKQPGSFLENETLTDLTPEKFHIYPQKDLFVSASFIIVKC